MIHMLLDCSSARLYAIISAPVHSRWLFWKWIRYTLTSTEFYSNLPRSADGAQSTGHLLACINEPTALSAPEPAVATKIQFRYTPTTAETTERAKKPRSFSTERAIRPCDWHTLIDGYQLAATQLPRLELQDHAVSLDMHADAARRTAIDPK